jgi:hypothetical protein
MLHADDVGSTLEARNGVAFAWAKVSKAGGQSVTNADPLGDTPIEYRGPS